jgi:hypothetical protein
MGAFISAGFDCHRGLLFWWAIVIAMVSGSYWVVLTAGFGSPSTNAQGNALSQLEIGEYSEHFALILQKREGKGRISIKVMG